MPEMDGYELATAIREDERGSKTRAPIVAITANALQGEAERCIAAGMDDYLSKPVAMPALQAMLKKWVPSQKTTAPHVDTDVHEDTPVPEVTAAPEDTDAPRESTPSNGKDATVEAEAKVEVPSNGGSPIDDRALKDMFGDDDETFKDILNSFVEPSADIIKDIKSGHENRIAKDIAAGAHSLKSSARSVGAMALADACLALETAGKSEDWDTIDEVTPKLDGLMVQVTDYIGAL